MAIDSNGLKRDGYAVVRGIPETHLIRLAQELGPLRADPRSPELVRDIRPQPADLAKKNTLSSRYGTNAFPFHTDTAHWDRPARYLLLYCVDPGEGKRTTQVQDTRLWCLDQGIIDLMCRALWRTGHINPRLCTLAESEQDKLHIRYDMDCMRPMTAEAREVKALVEISINASPAMQIDWQPEALLILDNRRVLHARGKSSGADTNRVHKRILIGEE
jgi:L-asparagine oxygenase